MHIVFRLLYPTTPIRYKFSFTYLAHHDWGHFVLCTPFPPIIKCFPSPTVLGAAEALAPDLGWASRSPPAVHLGAACICCTDCLAAWLSRSALDRMSPFTFPSASERGCAAVRNSCACTLLLPCTLREASITVASSEHRPSLSTGPALEFNRAHFGHIDNVPVSARISQSI